MGYVKLIARNAGKFVTYRDVKGNAEPDPKVPGDFRNRKDRISLNDYNGKLDKSKEKRCETDFRDCPNNMLHVTTIANGLSVLCGLRPVPTTKLNGHFVLNVLKRNDFITEIARKSYVRVLTIANVSKTFTRKGGGTWEKFFSEIKICHPWYMSPESALSVDLSKLTCTTYSVLTWDRLLARLADSIADFGIVLSNLTGICRSELINSPLPDVIKTAHKKFLNLPYDKQKEISNALLEIKCKWLHDLLTTGKTAVDLRYTKGFELMNTKRAAEVIVNDYEIYVPHSETLEQMLKNGCGFATILEGGMLRYSGYVYELPDGVELAV